MCQEISQSSCDFRLACNKSATTTPRVNPKAKFSTAMTPRKPRLTGLRPHVQSLTPPHQEGALWDLARHADFGKPWSLRWRLGGKVFLSDWGYLGRRRPLPCEGYVFGWVAKRFRPPRVRAKRFERGLSEAFSLTLAARLGQADALSRKGSNHLPGEPS